MSESSPLKAMGAAREKVASLVAERQLRAGGLHADDGRIAGEIASHQFRLGKLAKATRDHLERCTTAIKEGNAFLSSIQVVREQLQGEMDILTHDRLPA